MDQGFREGKSHEKDTNDCDFFESSSLIKDLTCMVKEQKTKLAEVSKLKQETAANLQVRHYHYISFLTFYVIFFKYIVIILGSIQL